MSSRFDPTGAPAAGGRAGLREAPRMRPAEFQLLRRLIRERASISLGDEKAAMLRARLGKLLREGGHPSFRAYYQHVVDDPSGVALQRLLDAVTTNKTEFLREADHFQLLSRWSFPGGAAPRVWSAGCSTGEEPYSLVMTFADRLAAPQRADILATDISSRVLAHARAGIYPAARVDPLPLERRRRFFLRGEGSWAGHYRIKPQFAAWVRFRAHNLRDPLPAEPPFDAIFCRNVMIYFDRDAQEALVERLLERLRPGGLLFVGHAESLAGMRLPRGRVETVAPSVYRARGG